MHVNDFSVSDHKNDRHARFNNNVECVHTYSIVVVSREVCVPAGPWLLRQRRTRVVVGRDSSRDRASRASRARDDDRPGTARISAAALIFYETLPPSTHPPLRGLRPSEHSARVTANVTGTRDGTGIGKSVNGKNLSRRSAMVIMKNYNAKSFSERKLRDTPPPLHTCYFEQS